MNQPEILTKQEVRPQLTLNYSLRKSVPTVSQQGTIPKKKMKKVGPWTIISSTLLAVVMIVALFFFIAQATRPDYHPYPLTNEELKSVTQLRLALMDRVGTAGLPDPLHLTRRNNQSPPIETGPGGKPLFFTSGAEYCPYCASDRWAIVVALSQFGTFQKMHRILSLENSIATFTFQGSTYNSPYLEWMTLERPQDTGQPVTKPTDQQKRILDTYNTKQYVDEEFAGKVPFIDIGNQYLMAGAAFDVHMLIDHSWQEIANGLNDPNNQITRNILGTANYMTAAICTITGEQPASICQRSVIQQIQQATKN